MKTLLAFIFMTCFMWGFSYAADFSNVKRVVSVLVIDNSLEFLTLTDVDVGEAVAFRPDDSALLIRYTELAIRNDYSKRNVDSVSTAQAVGRSIFNEATLSGRFSGSDI